MLVVKQFKVIAFYLFLIFMLISCSEERYSKVDDFNINSISGNEYYPSRMSYFSILSQNNPKKGTVVFDTDNVALKYFDGEKWDFVTNLRGNNSISKNLSDVENTIPDNLYQLGRYNNSLYLSKSLTNKPYWLKVVFNFDSIPELITGNKFEELRVVVSKNRSEKFAHDSKLIIEDEIGYVAYYSNDISTVEGEKNQVIRLAVFNINEPSKKEIYDIFQPNFKYNTFKTDYLATYTPVIFKTQDKKIRILGRLYVNYLERYYFRDFDPDTKTLTEPELCKIKNKDGSIVEFNTKNIEKHIGNLFGNNFTLSTNKNYMFLVSESVYKHNYLYLGLTIGEFTGDKFLNTGTTLLIKTNDEGKTFECLGAPNPNLINNKYTKQFVEGAFDFTTENEITMLGRNDVGALMMSVSKNRGMTFSNPIPLNDEYGYNTKASKPVFKNVGNGNFLTIWNIQEDYFDPKKGYSDRTVLDIRCGNNKEILGNKLIARIRSHFGCHYPSFAEFQNDYYLTLSGDFSRNSPKSVGDISIIKMNKSVFQN
jgi:hypothetical protein